MLFRLRRLSEEQQLQGVVERRFVSSQGPWRIGQQDEDQNKEEERLIERRVGAEKALYSKNSRPSEYRSTKTDVSKRMNDYGSNDAMSLFLSLKAEARKKP